MKLHPLCALFPPLTMIEAERLAEDIRTNGLLNPIVTYEGQILDGGNRYRACIDSGVEPVYAPYEGRDLVGYVLSCNLHRRHLSAGQHAIIVANVQDWEKAHGQGGDGSNQHKSKGATLPLCSFDEQIQSLNDDLTLPVSKHETTSGADVIALSSVADRASQSGVSVRTQKMADKVVKADPELSLQVAHGEISLPEALRQVEGKPKKVRTKKPKPETIDLKEGPAVPQLMAKVEELRAELKEVRTLCIEWQEQCTEYESVIKGYIEDNDSMARVFEANDQVKASMDEAKRYRELARVLQTQINGYMSEKSQLIREVKNLRRQLGKQAA